MGTRHVHGNESRSLGGNFFDRSVRNNFSKKKKKEPTSRLFSLFFLPAFCQSSIEQETTHFISVTHNDGLVLQPWLILRTSISQAESLHVPCLEGLLIWCRWTAQEELIHSLQQFFFWPLHNVDFLLVCWHLKTLILWFNWYSSATSTQYFPVLFDVGVIYSPLPGMGKLVCCDKMCEFTRQQEPLNAHHNGTAANVGHFPIPILPGAFQQMKCHHGPGLDPHSQPLPAALTTLCRAQME